MKMFLILLAVGIFAGSQGQACEMCDGKGMNPENRKMMAEAHAKVAECLNKDPKETSMEDCHKIMMEAMGDKAGKGEGMSCHHGESCTGKCDGTHKGKGKGKKAK